MSAAHQLFCYGSNGPARLRERLGRRVTTQAASAPGFVRVFRGHSRTWGGGVASLEPKKGWATYGLVAAVDDEDLDVMDRFEGVATRNYKRKAIAVELLDGRRIKAVAYVATSRTFAAPTKPYLEAVAKTIGTHWRSVDGGRVTWKDITIR